MNQKGQELQETKQNHYEELKISRFIFDEELQKDRLVTDVYKLRLTDHWKDKLQERFDLDVFDYYGEMCTQGSIVDRYKFAAVVWALLNGAGHVFSEDETVGLIDIAVKHLGLDELAMVVLGALTAALMPQEAYEAFKMTVLSYGNQVSF
ncbi:hypothetical protein [Bacillus sp. FDAARGOS_235]|uniref:hypothetical protein n=1 Tax=Bacillus sp. FDAARGOS_235 TaxID=1839798 RepID=UPI0009B6FE81|nr:hypothetical protein [Bacillus sp. FDAARGOS_235]ARC27659.1 hypothetical protein A6J74_01175 [Bacillus sp. FDAARGOS_235]